MSGWKEGPLRKSHLPLSTSFGALKNIPGGTGALLRLGVPDVGSPCADEGMTLRHRSCTLSEERAAGVPSGCTELLLFAQSQVVLT